MPTRPPATIALVGISVLIYLALSFLNQDAVMRSLLISEYIRPVLPEIRQGQWWRLITPIFLHFGLFHIAFNMLWTWELGRLIEARQGVAMLLGVTLLVGVVSNLGQYYANGPGFGGMSGVIYGYFGFVWIQSLYNPAFGIRLNPPVVYLLLGWFVLCWSGILELLFNLQVANSAHTAGLVSGILLGFAVCAYYRRPG